jgi:DNA adenine methylase
MHMTTTITDADIVCTPFIKWAGGKRWLVPTIVPAIRRRLVATQGRYFEPFLGGGAVALGLGLPCMVLADICEPLISTYRTIRKSPEAVAWALKTLADKGTDKASYLAVRSAKPTSSVFSAARFIYLNKFGFNGLYRENSKGQFNVPYGGERANASLPGAAELRAVAQTFTNAEINLADFRATIQQARSGDVIYADPPYFDTFSDYNAASFDDDAHDELARALAAAAARGATVIASNSDHEFIREIYSWAHVVAMTERHVVGAKGTRRGARNSVLITSDPALLAASDLHFSDSHEEC